MRYSNFLIEYIFQQLNTLMLASSLMESTPMNEIGMIFNYTVVFKIVYIENLR